MKGTSKIRMNRKSVRTFRRLERLYLQNFSVIFDFRVPMYVETQDRSIPFQVFACEPDRMVPQASLFRPDRTRIQADHEDVATFRYLYKPAKAATARSKPDIQLQTP